MKTIVQMMLISMLLMVAAPSYSAQATQMWKCELEEKATEEDVQELVSAWLKAAKQLPGGEQLEAYVFMPVAAAPTGETDFFIISVSPSFADWGKFWDAYPDSPAADAEEQAHEKFVCPDSGLWESIQVQ